MPIDTHSHRRSQTRGKGSAVSRNPIEELLKTNEVVERRLSAPNSRGEIAQDALAHFRHLSEHLAMAVVHGAAFVGSDYYEAIKPALNELSRRAGMKFLLEFHRLLQKSVSHYSLSQDAAQRLLIKYREYLILCKELASEALGIEILNGLGNIDWNEDPGLKEYYDLIYEKVTSFDIGVSAAIRRDRYYVYSRKSVFSDNHMFYEYALVPAMDFTSKFDHVIAFSQERIPTNYAIAISIKRSSVSALGGTLPVMILDGWQTSIRPCEINKLLKILGSDQTISGQLNSYRSLMGILTRTKMSLVDLCTLPDDDFRQLVKYIEVSGSKIGMEELLERSRSLLLSQKRGSNTLRYLLHKPRHMIISNQFHAKSNDYLSGLHLSNGCIPFDKQPFCTSLLKHSPSHYDVAACIEPEDYEDNLFVRSVMEKEESSGCIYINDNELKAFPQPSSLIEKYNSNLYSGHTNRRMMYDMRHFFLKGAEDDLFYIIQRLTHLSKFGIPGYRSSTVAKLSSLTPKIDDQQKLEIASSLFEKNSVALLYGAAGTGKTTFINIVCSLFPTSVKAAIANTNPAVDNLRHRIKDSNCEFMTIAKYLGQKHEHSYDLLIIDECSTVSNSDMKSILTRGGFQLLLLVGDTHQIEAIRLGNWFNISKYFLDDQCLFQLQNSWRTASDDIKKLWHSVRVIESDIAEKLVSCGVSKPLSQDLLLAASEDEIILCLNYDGLYGINNINRILQMANPNSPIQWGLQTFKVGDPILFNESGRFTPVLFNNLKGRLTKLTLVDHDLLQVEAIVETPLNAFEVAGVAGLSFIESYTNGTTKIGFEISKHSESDEGFASPSSIIPFQIAYAVSIHKAQGLEYDSVKIVVTQDVESRITHSIFYTAITRAKNHLKVYWSPETQERVLQGFTYMNNNKDSQLVARRRGLQLNKRTTKKGS